MGTDCRIYAGEKWCDLDRWHHFSDEFKSREILTKAEMLARLEKMQLNIGPQYVGEDQPRIDRRKHWEKTAIDFVTQTEGDELAFYADYDIDYLPDHLQ